jgi:hypothetical protein
MKSAEVVAFRSPDAPGYCIDIHGVYDDLKVRAPLSTISKKVVPSPPSSGMVPNGGVRSRDVGKERAG